MKFFKENKPTIKLIIILFLIWRLSLVLFASLGTQLIPQRPDYTGPSPWANFDGVHYLHIAQNGYSQFQQAFFPLYPLLIRYLSQLTQNYLLSGLFISHLSYLTALFLFYRLVKLDYPEEVAQRSLIYLLLFPTSFYFISVYTESLFLSLILGAFYALRKKRFWLSGLLGALSTTTRLVGIFLLPAFLFEWHRQGKTQKTSSSQLISIFLIPLGLLVYMWYLHKTTGNPLYFIHVQPAFGAQRTGGQIILLYQVFWRYLKMLLTVEKMSFTYFVVVLEFLIGAGFPFLLYFAYRQKIRPDYLIFATLAYLIPTFTGTFSSLPRYVLVCFPCFLVMGLIKNKKARLFLYGLSLVLLTACVILFTRGYWVS